MDDTLTTVLQLVDSFMTLGLLVTILFMFLRGTIRSGSMVDAERCRDEEAEHKVEALYNKVIEADRLRIAGLEAQLQEKNQQAATSLALLQAFQGTQDQAARAAKALLGGRETDVTD